MGKYVCKHQSLLMMLPKQSVSNPLTVTHLYMIDVAGDIMEAGWGTYATYSTSIGRTTWFNHRSDMFKSMRTLCLMFMPYA